jgi:hypothetical protein
MVSRIMRMPSFLRIEPNTVKPTLDCDYQDVLTALSLEPDTQRREWLEGLLRRRERIWKQLPLVTVADLLEHTVGR